MRKLGLLFSFLLLISFSSTFGTTPYVMSTGNYSESFSDIVNWTNGFAAGTGAQYWGGVAVNATGAIPDGIKTTATTATFATSGSSGGVQRGSLSGNVAGTIVQLSTGTTDNTTSNAIDLFLDFSGRTAGTLSFSWAEVNNGSGDRHSSLKVYGSTDGVTFTEITGTGLPINVTNNVASSGTISTVTLPTSFNGTSTARIR